MLNSDPGEEGDAEGEVEESLIGDRQDDEDWGEGEEKNHEAVQIVIVWL